MKPLLSNLDRISQRLFRRSYGWIGLEIGCHTIDMAQVRMFDGRWQLAAVWSLEHPITGETIAVQETSKQEEFFGWLANEELLQHGLSRTFNRLENLNSLFLGRHCAATLTDGMISYRELELPASELSESKAMVHSEIALETESEMEELLTDCWSLPQCNPRASNSCFGAVSINQSAALRVASDLLDAGFECQTLDAMPCAMARSTSMMFRDENLSTLSIDLGYHHAMLTLVKGGRPLLSRGVRSLGLLTLLERIAAAFEITRSDAKTLLFQSVPILSETSTVAQEYSNPIHPHLSSFLQSLTSEIDKTLLYTNKMVRDAIPTQLLLMGAGTQISCLDKSISERVGLPAYSWTIDLSENLFGNQHTGTYAIAAGLSALAWETM